MAFTGGPVPRTVQFPFGETPLECARWPGYDGWLAVVNSGFRAERAPPSPVGHLPIARGFYVARPHRCDEAGSLFRYDGAGMAWLSGGPEDPAALYPIRSVREEEGRSVATISSPGPGAKGAAEPRDVTVIVAPQPSGLVTVEAYASEEMRLCGPDELPAWARDRGAAAKAVPAAPTTATDAPSADADEPEAGAKCAFEERDPAQRPKHYVPANRDSNIIFHQPPGGPCGRTPTRTARSPSCAGAI
jgi:hypothetical protein